MFALTSFDSNVSTPRYSTVATISGYLNVWVPIPVDSKLVNIFWLKLTNDVPPIPASDNLNELLSIFVTMYCWFGVVDNPEIVVPSCSYTILSPSLKLWFSKFIWFKIVDTFDGWTDNFLFSYPSPPESTFTPTIVLLTEPTISLCIPPVVTASPIASVLSAAAAATVWDS